MFRRRDEDENNEYSLQPAPKAPNQPVSAASGQQTVASRAEEQKPSPVPFIKASQAATKDETVKVDAAQKAAKPAPSASFIPSALRTPPAPVAAPANANASQPVPTSAPVAAATPSTPSFTSNSANQNIMSAPKNTQNFKVENIGVETERRLTVGYGIALEGKVSDCDKLVIYGSVNAELNNVKALQISESGKFNGAAEIEYAEISGLFEGELKVRKNIVINSTGRVSGKITYGSIEIKPGGKFTGEIVEDKSLSEAAESSSEPASSDDRSINISEGFSLFDKNENKAA